MKNKYLDFIADKYLLECITNLHKSYVKAKNNISKKDTIDSLQVIILKKN